MQDEKIYPKMKVGDIFVTLDDSRLRNGDTPLKKGLYLKTEEGRTELDGVTLLYAKEMRLSVRASRETHNDAKEGFARGLYQGSCIFHKNADPDSNFYKVEQGMKGAIWIKNSGKRPLRFQGKYGWQYLVHAGNIGRIPPLISEDRMEPIRVLLDVDSDGGTLDIRIRAAYIFDNGGWQRGDVVMCCGSYVDSYHLRVRYQDACIGVFEAYSSYYMERPALDILDIDSYGAGRWYVRNVGGAPLAIRGTKIGDAELPADQKVYELDNPSFPAQFEQEVPLL